MNRRRAAYTLLEVTVVLVILAIAGAVAAPAFASLRPARGLDAATSQVISALNAARTQAVAGGGAVQVTFEVPGARVWLHPRDTSFVMTLPDDCRLEGTARTHVRYSADGAASGAAPTVACGTARAQIAIDALTGTPSAVERP